MNLSGIGINKVFRTAIEPGKPYYYISGSLDLSGAVYGGTYFFNFDNNLSYATTRDYANFIMVDDSVVISEVLVYTEPDVDAVNPQSTWLAIGGADYTAVDKSVKVWWAAPPAFGPYNWVNVAIASGARNGSNLCTITTAEPHLLVSGQSVTVSSSKAILNIVDQQVTVTGPNTFTYTNSAQRTMASVARNGSNVATVVTAAPHGWANGQVVNVNAVDNTFDATGVSITVVNSTTFTYANAGGSVATQADAGTVTPTLASTAVTGSVVLSSGPFFNGYPLDENQVNSGPVSYYGHEGGHFPYYKDPTTDPITSNTSKKYKYLAVTILDELPDYPVVPQYLLNEQSSAVDGSAEDPSVVILESLSDASKSKSVSSGRQRKVVYKGLPTGEKAINAGRLTVTLKVYPKTQ